LGGVICFWVHEKSAMALSKVKRILVGFMGRILV
jgi:hypothetical protein